MGVFPLVFCVDAILPNEDDRPSCSRSQFDKFLDTIEASSSMVDDDDDIHDGGPMMQRVEEEQSDNEDEILLKKSGSLPPAGNFRRRSSAVIKSAGGVIQEQTIPESPQPNQQQGRRGSSLRSPLRMTFKKIGSKRSIRNNNRNSSSGDATGNETGSGNSSLSSHPTRIDVSPEFSEALQQGQSFFQRARTVSTSARHGFPPSKDPNGQSNRVIALTGLLPGQQHQSQSQQQNRQQMLSRLKSATQNRPIDGILPSGWLAKHAAALPSVIVVVAQIHPPHQQSQQRQDDMLVESLENLKYSLAPKRKVDVKVVALVQEGVSPILADQWSQGIIGRLPSFLRNNDADNFDHEHLVTLVHEIELRSDDKKDASSGVNKNNTTNASADSSSSALSRLHRNIRKSSLRYYKDRSQEVKGKLLRLGGPQAATNLSPTLFPLIIRYYFKAAVFYEFQWKQEKSLKYMAEAYRLVEIYYGYLLMLQHHQESNVQDDNDDDDDNDDEYDGDMNKNTPIDSNMEIPALPDISTIPSSNSEEDDGEGVEMSLSSKTATTAATTTAESVSDQYYAATALPIAAEDMTHQCRTVADWLNFKILQMCLVSHDKKGMLAASVQWQHHALAFCCPRRSFLHTTVAPWLDWSYVSQQFIVVSQLLERHPPRALGELGALKSGHFDETLLRCCPWRTYEAGAEALLKAGHQIKLVTDQGGLSSMPLVKENQDGALRIRYVGGIDHEGFRPHFEEESKKNHMERALNCALRGITLYEKEMHSLKKSNTLISWTRSGARLYYLAGGALLGLKRHSEAVPHLEKAVRLCEGWSHLESIVRRLLIKCHEKQGGDSMGSVDSDVAIRQTRTSFLLDCYFGAKLSANELSSALDRLARMNNLDTFESGGDKCLRWNWICIDGETGGTAGQPFSFALTFPVGTHATAGEKVKAKVWIKSNLGHGVCVNHMSILSFLGPLSISPKYFPATSNETAGEKGMMIVQPNEAIEFDIELNLKMDLNPTEIDGTSSAVGENNISVSASSPVKIVNPKLRTSGFTAGAGTRFALEDDSLPNSSGTESLNRRCLGGKILRCKGIVMEFSPLVSATDSSEGRKTCIELTMKLEETDPQSNTRRTTFDQNNYASSAWKRPASLQMNRGSRCLRLLPRTANMMVTNITAEYTQGKVLEGTINRVVLKLKAAENELCTSIMIRVNCSSILTTAEGENRQISLKESDADIQDENVEDIMNPRVRNPVLVKTDVTSRGSITNFGYTLPDGWSTVGDGSGGNDDYKIVASTLNAGEVAYAYFDLYRPTPDLLGIDDILGEMKRYNDNKCETNIDISIRYYQEGKDDVKKASSDDVEKDFVALNHSVTVLWTSPISVTFSSSGQDAYPCGNRHTSNTMSDPLGLPEKETILHDKEKVLTKGIIDSTASTDGLFVGIDKVQFIDNEEENTHCKFKLLSGYDADGTIYRGEVGHPCRTLSVGSKISFAWMTEAIMGNPYLDESLTVPIGSILVLWKPSPIKLSKEVRFLVNDDFAGSHGPLKLQRSAACHFSGPLCHIESAPFEVNPEHLPDSIQVVVPFEVAYSIKNNTPIDQELEVILQDASAPGDDANDAFLISGLVNKKTSIGPYESHSFSYTALPIKVGRVNLPSISISSTRYRTWIIRESLHRRSIYVTP